MEDQTWISLSEDISYSPSAGDTIAVELDAIDGDGERRGSSLEVTDVEIIKVGRYYSREGKSGRKVLVDTSGLPDDRKILDVAGTKPAWQIAASSDGWLEAI
ncbi:MAG: hypothetical protein ABEN55_13505 [Bradymonadaceae bacterium]